MLNDIMNEKNWHLRIGVTSSCNFRCIYCNPKGLHTKLEDVSFNDLCNLISAASANGISRIHWTGGEPTIRSDLIELMKYAKSNGITQQVITTNGKTLYKNIDQYISAGLTRVIVSIDTLNKKRFKELTGVDALDDVLKTIEACLKYLPTMTKLSIVTMKSTLSELEDFVNFVNDMNHKGYVGRLAMKLNQFFPCNPHQLDESGCKYWAEEYITREVILNELSNISPLIPIERKVIEGDNPTYDYFYMKSKDVIVGVLTLFSLDYPCGRCHKLRVQPSGNLSICLQQEETYNFSGKTYDQMKKLISTVFKIREELDITHPDRKHYRSQLGELRFGRVNQARNIEYFKEQLNRQQNNEEKNDD